MKVLVLNCGSSSIKFQMFEMDKEDNIAKGIVEKIGSSNAILTFKPKGREKIVQTREIINHKVALDLVLNTLRNSQYGILKSKS
ncbi:MAG: acetate kinase, partial [Candidatus Marinimicrobia bacterium]|nr:acetate kinase [Candidatus Neomarinimicrobiota bacterium]